MTIIIFELDSQIKVIIKKEYHTLMLISTLSKGYEPYRDNSSLI